MYTFVPLDHSPFRDAWKRALKQGGKRARIANFSEVSMLRATAVRPHEPGKPWIVYLDGASPFWQNHITTSTAIVLGHRGDEPWVLLVHDLPLFERSAKPKGDWELGNPETDFLLSFDEWMGLIEATPRECQMSLARFQCLTTSPRKNDGCFRGTQMLENPFFQALFGAALEPYAKEHHAIATEYLLNRICHHDGLKKIAPEHQELLRDHPLMSLDIYKMYRDVPERGARARYFVMEILQRARVEELHPWGETRQVEICLMGPKDDAINLVVMTPD